MCKHYRRLHKTAKSRIRLASRQLMSTILLRKGIAARKVLCSLRTRSRLHSQVFCDLGGDEDSVTRVVKIRVLETPTKLEAGSSGATTCYLVCPTKNFSAEFGINKEQWLSEVFQKMVCLLRLVEDLTAQHPFSHRCCIPLAMPLQTRSFSRSSWQAPTCIVSWKFVAFSVPPQCALDV